MNYTSSEMMTVAAARALGNQDICFVGIGLPSAACNLARLTHAPSLTLIYESGTLETRPATLPLSIGDGELCETALTTVSVPVGFLGGAQVDRFGNLNSTVIGEYAHPKVRLPGSGGASEIASGCGQIFIVMRHNARSFVAQLDFLTTLGHGRTGRERRELGIPTKGPTLLVTDLCIMQPEPESNEMVVTSIHPDVTREQIRKGTGWDIRFAPAVEETAPPAAEELEVLRALHARTAEITA